MTQTKGHNQPKKSVVYLINIINTDLYKIGYTCNLEKRLKAFTKAWYPPSERLCKIYPYLHLPLLLKVIKTFETLNPKADEYCLHQAQQQYRAFCGATCEWFKLPWQMIEDLSWFKSCYSNNEKSTKTTILKLVESKPELVQAEDIHIALKVLESLGVDVTDKELLFALQQCKDKKLLKNALQVIEDDAREISYPNYSAEWATELVYSIAITNN